MTAPRQPIRRDDGELCGFVAPLAGGFAALTVFGGHLGTADHHDEAAALVLATGLASLAERWLLFGDGDDDGQIVCIQEASPDGVTLALDYCSMPGVPTLRISADELRRGAHRLQRA